MIDADRILDAPILVVDDQPANVALLEQMLRGVGYRSVTSTRDPRAVGELHRAHRYALILLDVQMPGMDGFEVMEELKALEAKSYLPVIVITAQPSHKIRALHAGARDFVSKPFEVAEVLMRVRNAIEARLLHLQTHELYERVVEEQRQSERLLHNVLPRCIAARLKRADADAAEPLAEVIADSFADATVLFADIVGFSQLSMDLSAQALVALLNQIFSEFDRICDLRGLEKIKTIGDAYMAVAGLPDSVVDHPDRAANVALDMLESMSAFNARTGHLVRLRLGINTGAGVAGVIGRRRLIYDLWGDAVNVASRMEAHGVAGRIQISDTTRRRLGPGFLVEPRGDIELKGRGVVRTWFLNGRT
ncbi:MAG: response regulator [Deltaproteobacteria bacterium]|nr:response regulator [Deltaproteobacteria bacterium]MCB9787992.1 response regulator [Deltaproteobacteria bacterium]